MIRTNVNNDSLLNYEPSLDRLYPKGYSDFNIQINEALRYILQELKKQKKDIKKYCTPLLVNDSVSGEDLIERMLLVLKISSLTDNPIIVLSGCNTEDGTFEDVETVAITEIGVKEVSIYNPFKYYKITSTGTISFTSEL